MCEKRRKIAGKWVWKMIRLVYGAWLPCFAYSPVPQLCPKSVSQSASRSGCYSVSKSASQSKIPSLLSRHGAVPSVQRRLPLASSFSQVLLLPCSIIGIRWTFFFRQEGGGLFFRSNFHQQLQFECEVTVPRFHYAHRRTQPTGLEAIVWVLLLWFQFCGFFRPAASI